MNAWAELVTVTSQYVYKMPTGMSFQDGAALAMNYVTAYMMLFEMANLKKGDSVLCHSMGGGVVRLKNWHCIKYVLNLWDSNLHKQTHIGLT